MTKKLDSAKTLYISPYKKHKCTGSPSYSSVTVRLEGMQKDVTLIQCSTCGKLFVRNNDARNISIKSRVGTIPYKTATSYATPKPVKKILKPTIKDPTPSLSAKDFVVRTSVFNCTGSGHSVRDITAVMTILKPNGKVDTVEFPASYCETCGTYYLLDSEYSKLVKIGIPVCRIITEDIFKSIQSGDRRLNEESTLHALGYNVNAQNALTEAQRRSILTIILENKLLTQAQIMSHLDFLISHSRGNALLEDARKKWESDRAFVGKYRENKDIIPVKSIKKRNYYKK